MNIKSLYEQFERVLKENNFNYSAPDVVKSARELESQLFKNV